MKLNTIWKLFFVLALDCFFCISVDSVDDSMIHLHCINFFPSSLCHEQDLCTASMDRNGHQQHTWSKWSSIVQVRPYQIY